MQQIFPPVQTLAPHNIEGPVAPLLLLLLLLVTPDALDEMPMNPPSPPFELLLVDTPAPVEIVSRGTPLPISSRAQPQKAASINGVVR